MDKGNELWRANNKRTMALARLATFYKYVTTSGLAHTSRVLSIGDISIGIACLNSAWASASDADRHNVALTQAQIAEELELCSPAQLKIALWHHPFGWLADSDAAVAREQLLVNFSVGMMGHLHADEAMGHTAPFGECYFVQAPSLYDKESNNGFLVVEIDFDARSVQIESFRWSAKLAKYVSNTEFAVNGLWTGPLPDKTGLDARTMQLRTKAMAAMKERLRSRLTRHLPMPEVAAMSVSEVDSRFIEPNLIAKEGGKIIRLGKIITHRQNWLLIGAAQSGKSTTLDYIGLKLLAAGFLAVPVTFKAVEKAGRQGLVGLLASCLAVSKTQADKLANAPTVLLLDDADLADSGRWAILASWKEACPKLRLLATAKPIVGFEWKDAQWRVSEIRPLSLERVRSELTRFFKEGKTHRLDVSIDTLVDAELPRWPWVILILLELARRASTANVSNLATLLRHYADLCVGSFEPEGGDRAGVRLRLLRRFASEMMATNTWLLSDDAAVHLIQEELGASGVPGDPQQTLEDLISTRLVAREDAGIAFSFFVLQEYFYAENLRESAWSNVEEIDADGLIRKGGALAFYAEMVDLKGHLVDRCFSIAESEAPSATPFRLEDRADLTHIFEPTVTPEKSVSTAKNAVPSQESLEENVGHAEDRAVGRRRARVVGGAEAMEALQRFVQEMHASVVVLRNAMWLGLAEKRRSVRRTLDLAARLVAQFVAEFTTGEEDRAQRLVNILSAVVLFVVGSVVAGAGSVRHLASAIREELRASDLDELRRLFLFMWYIEIGGEGVDAALDDIVPQLQSNHALQVLELFLMFKLVNALSYHTGDSGSVEAMLRTVASERVRRSAQWSATAVEVKASADRAVQRALRVAQGIASDRDPNKD